MGQITLISGRERRRHWSSKERARILAAISAPGAVVAEIARREEICTSLVYKWRRAAHVTANRVEFAPVIVESAPSSLPAPSPGNAGEAGVIVVEMNDARVRIGAQAPAALIAATLKALRA